MPTLYCDYWDPGDNSSEGGVDCTNAATGALFYNDPMAPEDGADHLTCFLTCDEHAMEMAHEMKSDGTDPLFGATLTNIQRLV